MTATPTILRNTFHHDQFNDPRRLVALKAKKGVTISLAFPTLNEAQTIGKEILILKAELMDRVPLLDEIAVIDSGSTDETRSVAARYGAKVYNSREILKRCGSFRGKGENLWKSLYVLSGDIIVWIDADIANIAPRFLYGLVGPLLQDDRLAYVKAFYERPLRFPGGLFPGAGGRVTEILVRPLFSLLYPELAYLFQPLSGEYAGRRSLLERLPFSVGYGVEIGHLIDIYHLQGTQSIAQVDLDMRLHRNQPIQALSRMSFGILNTFVNRLERYGEAHLLRELHTEHLAPLVKNRRYSVLCSPVPIPERPPIKEIEEYRRKFGLGP